MSSFKIHNTTSNTSIDLVDMFVKRSDIAALRSPSYGYGLWLWGSGNGAQLGDNGGVARSSPVQTYNLTFQYGTAPGAPSLYGGTTWSTVSCGQAHTAAIKTDGTLWMWGTNTWGQIGDSTVTAKYFPVSPFGSITWSAVACSSSGTAAIQTDGTLWTWGVNMLGVDSPAWRSSPAQTVAGGNNWSKVSAGANFVVAIKTDGTLWGWGNNAYGQLGTNNTTLGNYSPIQTVGQGTNWSSASCGNGHVAAIKTDGRLWLWGKNDYGQLGTNSVTYTSSPVQVVGQGTTWKQVAAGGDNTAAVKTDGTLWTWGGNTYGQLGDNTTQGKTSPVQTVAGGTTWARVAVGGNHMAAIKTDGTLWTWGYNISGQLGDNTGTYRSSPVQTVAGRTNWLHVAAGQSHTAAIDYYSDGFIPVPSMYQ